MKKKFFLTAASLLYVLGGFAQGLMKAQARRNHPRYVINRRRISRLFQQLRITNEKCIKSNSS